MTKQTVILCAGSVEMVEDRSDSGRRVLEGCDGKDI